MNESTAGHHGWYDERPWLALYPEGQPAHITIEHATVLAMWQASVARAPDRALIHYFDTTLTLREVDRQSDALACALQERGFRSGDRLGIYLQNVPQWVISLLAAWKAGGVAVAINR